MSDTKGPFEFRRPLLLDLFCGAGGASRGYHDAGFRIIGVDRDPQPNYPYPFIQDDALAVLRSDLDGFVAIHASPPCQAYTNLRSKEREHPDLIGPVRELLRATRLPYVIENVETAPLMDPIRLCGSSFGLDVRRHRLFESNVPLHGLPCVHGWQKPRFRSLDASMVKEGRKAGVVGVHGNINYAGEFELRKRAMGIDWMTNAELVEAIPPAYTRFIGAQIIARHQHALVEAAA